MTLKTRLFAILALALLGGCDDTLGLFSEEVSTDSGSANEDSLTDDTSSATASAIESTEGTGPGTDTGTETATQDPAATFVGTWGTLLSAPIHKQTGIPLIHTQIVLGRTFSLTHVTSDGNGTLTLHEQACAMYNKLEVPMNNIDVPEAFIAGLNPVIRQVTLTSNEPGTPFVSDDVYEVRGAKLEDPINDPLPVNHSGALPCDEAPFGSECDQDDDGKPGMTIALSGALNCQFYVAQRVHAQYGGGIVQKDTIAGPVLKSFTEQQVLGASSPLCENSNNDSVPIIDKCPDLFYFKMIRLAPAATCEDVMALTSCDETPNACDGDGSFALNPKNDAPEDCK